MSDVTITIGAQASEFNRNLEEAADLLRKFTGQSDLTGQQIKNNFGLAQRSVATFKDQIKLLEIEQRKANASLREARAAVLQYNRTTEGTKINLKNAAKAFKELAAQEKESTRGLTANEKKRKELLATLLRERGAVNNTKTALDNYRNGLSATTVASDRLRRANGDLIKSKGNLGGAFKRTLGFANQIAGVFGAGLGLYGLVRLFRSATGDIIKFDQAIRTLASISGATGDELERLSRLAMEVGSTSRYGAEGVAVMMTELAKMGFATEEIQNMTAGITKLATAANEDLRPTTETVANVIRAMGMDAEDTARIVDTMALSFTQSALDLSRFRESMKYIAPIAKQANFTLEDTSTILAKLADAGISGSLAGTSMRNVLSQLSDSSSALSSRLGFAVNDFEDFVRALEMMKEQGSELEDVFQVMDRRAASAFAVLLDGTKDLRELRVRFDEANGAADTMANIQLQSISNQTKLARNAWQGFILAMDKGDGVMSNMIRSTLTGFSRSMNDLSRSMTLQSKQMQEDVQILSTWERALANTNNSLEDKRKILDAMKSEYPEMFRNMDIELEKWEDITGVVSEALRVKKAYLDIQFGVEDLTEYSIGLERAQEDMSKLSRELQSFLLIGRDTPEFTGAIEQMTRTIEQFEGVSISAEQRQRLMQTAIKGTNITLEEFQKALRLESQIDNYNKKIQEQVLANELLAISTLDAADAIERLESLQSKITTFSNAYTASMNDIAKAAMDSGENQSEAFDKAYRDIEKEIKGRIESIKAAWEEDWPDAPPDAFRGDLVLIEQLERALIKVLEAKDKAIESSRRELRETEALLRLDQRIAEAQARITFDGIALEERLSQLKLYYADKIAKATMHGAELEKTLQINALQREIEAQAIRANLIRQNMQLDESAHRRKLQQLEIEKDATLQAVGVDEGLSPREAALRREMDMLDVALAYEQRAREEQTKNSIARVEAEIETIRNNRTRLTDEEKRLVADKEAEITAITEKAIHERKVAEREAVMERITLEKQLFDLKMDLAKEERDVAERAAQWERDLQMHQTQRIDNLWQAMDLFGQTTKRIREQERRNEAERLEAQLANIQGLKAANEERIRTLKIQLASLELDEAQALAIRKQIEELQKGLNDLDFEETQVTEFLRRVLNPEMDMSEWQNFISAMKGVGNQLVGIYQGVLDERYRIAQEERALLDRRISEMQRDLDLELRLNEQGFASNVQALMAAIEQEKQARDKALQEEKKQAQEKRRLEQIMQTVNLLTAVSNILKAESTKGLLGIATAAAGLGGLWMLWGSQASKAKSQTFEKGGSFLLDGPSHARGGVPLTPRHEAQGGELVSVFNRSATKKYGSQIKSMTDAINKGEYINPSVNSYNFDTTDIKAIRKLLEKESVTYADGYKIIRKGNTTIRCRLN